MKLKHRVGDFKVRELLREDYLEDSGPVRVYRVTKRKLTSPEAARVLAAEAGVGQEQVGLAGLKDRQGITVQHMSVVDGRDVRLEVEGLRIEPIGFARSPLESADSLGNAFDINVRALSPSEVSALRSNLDSVREGGVPNYFDDQRFGNLRAEQGWVPLDLARGRIEEGLRRMLCEPSPFDDDRHARLKRLLDEHWGDWLECLDVARRIGVHRSLFEHLAEHPTDFAGAFRHVAARTRLIHLYAWQSHVWNRAVAAWVRGRVAVDDRVVLESVEGPLVCPGTPLGAADLGRTLPLPGPGLQGVTDPEHERLFADVLAEDGLVPDQFRIEGVPGFQLKPEARSLFVVPRFLRVRPSQPDPEHRGGLMVRLRFELPRGSYATLVVKRLCSTRVGDRDEERGGEQAALDRVRRSGGERGAGGADFARGRPDRSRGFDEARRGPRRDGADSRFEGRRDGRGQYGDRRDGGGGRYQDRRDGGGRSFGGPRDGRGQYGDRRDGGGGRYQDRRDGGGRSFGGPRDGRGQYGDRRDGGGGRFQDRREGGGQAGFGARGGYRSDERRGGDRGGRFEGGGRGHGGWRGGPRGEWGRGPGRQVGGPGPRPWGRPGGADRDRDRDPRGRDRDGWNHRDRGEGRDRSTGDDDRDTRPGHRPFRGRGPGRDED
jgi:tRNA pseudouridine13 synthase